MGLIDWEMKRFINPRNTVERNYAIFGKKLIDQDHEIFGDIIEEIIDKLKSKIKLFYPLFLLFIIIFLITIFTPEPYLVLMMGLTILSLGLLIYVYLVSFFAHEEIGIYERSWIQFLKLKNISLNLSFLQKISLKTTSIVLSKTILYLENNNISPSITENEISYFAPKS